MNKNFTGLIITEPVRAGISACNFGARVRYNHGGWDRVAYLQREYDHFCWIPVCPEVMGGLGVPRAPVHLVGGTGYDFWQNHASMKDRTGRDVTSALKKGSEIALEILRHSEAEVFFFMEGSPTCGIYRTTLKNNRSGKPPGVFGALLLSLNYFLIPVSDLESPVKWWDWKRRLLAWVWLKRKNISSKQELYDIWHRFKFLCQEIDRSAAESTGRQLASLTGKPDSIFVESWKKEVLSLLKKPSTLPRIKSFLEKHYAHYRRVFGLGNRDLPAPVDEKSKKKLVDELRKMERRCLESGVEFAAVPVMFKHERYSRHTG